MKRLPLCFALSLMLYACQRNVKPQDTKDRLEKAMARFLDENQANKTKKLHFEVQDVTYFEDSTFYLCHFKIKMTLPDGRDTTGIMEKHVSRYTMQVEH